MSVFHSLLNNEFGVNRKMRAPDGEGGWPEVYVDIGTILGRLRPTTAAERTTADQEQARISHVLYTEAGEDIERGDIIIGGGNTVEVLALREPSHSDHHYEIDCRESQKEGEEWVS